MSHFLEADPSTALTHAVIGAAIAVHRHLGPGLFESVYEACLAAELRERGFVVREQVAVPVAYKGVRLECGFRLDLLIDDALIVEVKVAEKLAPIHTAQLLTYLRLTGLRAGLILNFNTRYLGQGSIKRVLLDR